MTRGVVVRSNDRHCWVSSWRGCMRTSIALSVIGELYRNLVTCRTTYSIAMPYPTLATILG